VVIITTVVVPGPGTPGTTPLRPIPTARPLGSRLDPDGALSPGAVGGGRLAGCAAVRIDLSDRAESHLATEMSVARQPCDV
jgi:hypothetical protein